MCCFLDMSSSFRATTTPNPYAAGPPPVSCTCKPTPLSTIRTSYLFGRLVIILLSIFVCKHLEQNNGKLKSWTPQLRLPNNGDRCTMIGNRLSVDEAYHTTALQSY